MRQSVPDIVRDIITNNRSVYECMRMNVINYTALAARIRPEVEREAGRVVNINTLAVAIKRYADSFSRDEGERAVLQNVRLSLTDGMLDIRFSARGGAEPADVLSRLSKATDDYDFFRLADSVRFLAEDMAPVRDMLGELDGEHACSSGLAKIRVTAPPGGLPPDIISHIAGILHANGIELQNAFFGDDTATIVVNERHASRAYEILRSRAGRAQ